MVILLDGGFSSQVQHYVNDKTIDSNPLWCTDFLLSNPDAVVKAHSDYIKAGCEIISTNTYQASLDGFQKHLGLDEAEGILLMKEAVELARRAISNSTSGGSVRDFVSSIVGRSVLLAGSVGPYGACLHDGSEYRGEYIERVSTAELMAWHRPRVAALVEAGVDLLAIETIPAIAEACAVLTLLQNEFPAQKAWVSFSCKDEKHISENSAFSEAVARCVATNRDQLLAVGVNCLAPSLVSPLLSSAQGLEVPFIVYPNSGEIWKPVQGWTNKSACLPLVNYLKEWISLGAVYIGGCCRTNAADIKQCREYIDTNNL